MTTLILYFEGICIEECTHLVFFLLLLNIRENLSMFVRADA